MDHSSKVRGMRAYCHTTKKALLQFIRMETTAGVVLLISTICALVIANSPWSSTYNSILQRVFGFHGGVFSLHKTVLLWINDGLMSSFFFLVGLEIKREFYEGAMRTYKEVVLPLAGALGGIIAPALVYVAINMNTTIPGALNGWAVPVATDIAFALAILSLLGRHVSPQVKIFLTTIAVFDDIGAVLIIAIFYTPHITLYSLCVAAGCVAVLIILNRCAVERISCYVLVGLILWLAVLKSGIHATLAGLVLAGCIPVFSDHVSPTWLLKKLENRMHYAIAYGVLPVFAFANSGVDLNHVRFEDFSHPIVCGIIAGLLLGKQLGITVMCWIVLRLKWAQYPLGLTWRDIYGVALLGGVGFTMSLFIGILAFDEMGFQYDAWLRLGVLLASLLSACLAYGWFRCSSISK